MTPVETAKANLAQAEAAAKDTQAAHERAESEFKRAPSPGHHTAEAVARQVAVNALAAVDVARASVAQAERDALTQELAKAITRAQPAALYSKVEPAMARLRELHAEVVQLVSSVESDCRQQHDAVREAEALAKTLSLSAPIPRRVAPTFIRAIVGIRIARDAYAAGARWTLGQEPHTFVAPRPAPHQGSDEWRKARAIALPAGEFLPPSPGYDYSQSLADAPEFYHRPMPNGRPQRHEVG